MSNNQAQQENNQQIDKILRDWLKKIDNKDASRSKREGRGQGICTGFLMAMVSEDGEETFRTMNYTTHGVMRGPAGDPSDWSLSYIIGYATMGVMKLTHPGMNLDQMIVDTLKKVAQDFQMNYQDVRLSIAWTDESKENYGLCVYKGTEPVNYVTFDYLFGDEVMETETEKTK